MCLHLMLIVLKCNTWEPASAAQQWVETRFAYNSSARNAVHTLFRMMDVTYADVVHREQTYGHIRFSYENTPHYEMGYVFGEIIERYKRMTDQFTRVHSFKNRHMYDFMDAVETMQKLFLETFHLVCMMHEVPHKYKHDKTFHELTMTDREREQIQLAEKEYFMAAEQQKRELKKALKKQLAKEMAEADESDLKSKPKLVKYVGGEAGMKYAINYNLSDAKTVGQGRGPHGHSLAFPRPGVGLPLHYGWDLEDW